MCDLPSSNQKFEIQTKWNLKKPGGWEKYIVATEDIASKIVNLVEEESNIDEVIKKVERLHNKAKFVAFDKTKIKQNKSTNKKILREQDTNKAEDLISRQSKQIEQEILEIKSSNQGRASKVFKMKERIGGSKKGSQDAHAVKDLATGELLVATELIKKATLEYNCEVEVIS